MPKLDVSVDMVKQLIGLLNENGLTEITLEDGNAKVIVKAEKTAVVSAPAAVSVAPVAQASTVASSAQACALPQDSASPQKSENVHVVTSPMVGTFYRSPAPDAASFCDVGQSVKEGQTLCIIEAMKLMNELESDISGKVVRFLVENGQPVEFGQALIEIEK